MTKAQKIISTIGILAWSIFGIIMLGAYFTAYTATQTPFCNGDTCYTLGDVLKGYSTDVLNRYLNEKYKISYDFTKAKQESLSDAEMNDEIVAEISDKQKPIVQHNILVVWFIGALIIGTISVVLYMIWGKNKIKV